MLGKTHVLGGMALCMGTFVALDCNDMLVPNVSEALQIGLMLPYAIWSSTLPDRDQDNKYKAEENPINLLIQKFFRLLKVPHRGAVSHLYPSGFFLGLAIGLMQMVLTTNNVSSNLCMGTLIVVGIACGLVSHTILDCFTIEGICGGKIRIVPRNSVFSSTCNGKPSIWESFWRKTLYLLNCLLLFCCVYLCIWK